MEVHWDTLRRDYEELLTAANLRQLTVTAVGWHGTRPLCQHPWLDRLCSLDLGSNNIGDEAAALLRGRWPFVRLKQGRAC